MKTIYNGLSGEGPRVLGQVRVFTLIFAVYRFLMELIPPLTLNNFVCGVVLEKISL